MYRVINIDDNELSKQLTTIYKNYLIDEKTKLMNEIEIVILAMQNFKYEEE